MYPENKTRAASVKVHEEINDMFRARLGQVPARWITNFPMYWSHRDLEAVEVGDILRCN